MTEHCKIRDAEHREKLKRLAQHRNFLLDLPHSKFHMPDYCSEDATENHCGTAGCSAGWTAVQFQSHGWRFRQLGDRFTEPVWSNCPGLDMLDDQTTDSYAMFYGITSREAEWITIGMWGATDLGEGHPLGYGPCYERVYGVEAEDITPAMVADRIARLLREYDPSLLDEPCAAPELAHVGH